MNPLRIPGGGGKPSRRASRSRVAGLSVGLLLLGSASACTEDTTHDVGAPGRPILQRLADAPAATVIGLREEGGNPLSLLHEVQDGVLTPDRILVLNGSDPWLRAFDPEGRFLYAAVPRGDGPGEAGRPRALSVASPGEIVLTEARRAQVLDLEGEPIRTLSVQDHLFRWAGRSCGDQDVLGLQPLGQDPPTRRLLVLAPEPGTAADTLLAWGPVRGAWTGREPPYVSVTDGGILLHAEELEPDRLWELDCVEGPTSVEGPAREIPLDSLGPPERYDELPGGGGLALYPAEPPIPSGLARVGDPLLWAVREIRDGIGGEPDSITVVRVLPGEGPERMVHVQGWHRLLDGSPDGRLLWSSHEPVAHLVVVRMEDLLEAARLR